MQMWIPLQENVTWSAGLLLAINGRRRRERESICISSHAELCEWAGGWGSGSLIQICLYLYLYLYFCMYFSSSRIMCGSVWWGHWSIWSRLDWIGEALVMKKGRNFLLSCFNPWFGNFWLLVFLSRWNCLLILSWVRSPKGFLKADTLLKYM